MFVLTKLQKEFRIAPHKLALPLLDAISGEIQSLFFNKVLKDLGLCVTLYDVRSVEGGFVFSGDGAPRFTVEFQLVMFRPFVGEVLTGKLKKCDKSGLYISLEFFEDIHIPEHLLQQPCEFDEGENVWIWKFNGNDFVMDLDEEVRFRVVQVKYPVIPTEQEKDSQPFAPMEIIHCEIFTSAHDLKVTETEGPLQRYPEKPSACDVPTPFAILPWMAEGLFNMATKFEMFDKMRSYIRPIELQELQSLQ